MRQHAILLQHPSAKVQFIEPVTPASIASAKAAQQAERAKAEAVGVHIADDGSFILPRPLNMDPLIIRALKRELPEGTCAACGEPCAMHLDSSGCMEIGCVGAINRRNGHQDGG